MNPSCKVFVDANILFSACRPGAHLHGLLYRLANEGRLATCDLAIDEAARNLARKRPEWAPNLATIVQRIIRVPTGRCPISISLPANDGALLGGAIAAGWAVFLTGDRGDFGTLYGQVIDGVLIVPPADFNP